MKFSAVAVAALVAGASAHYNGTVVYTTEVVTAITSYCPYETTVTHGTKTYTVPASSYLTVTDCPCTVTKPVYSSSVVHCNTCSTPAPSLPPVAQTPGPYPNATTPVIPPVASTPSAGPSAGTPGASSPVVSSPPIATGAAAKAFAASGAGLAGAFGVLAYLL